ncbi:MAG: glycosyltransferase [Arcobacter sp.]|uniref:glycosyltransferase n=1 Tax=Arcobacter sp. TaxID=1872629 RepID=UPI003C77FB44
MRIAVIVRSLKYGGMERAACNQSDAFYLAGHEADLIYFSNKEKNIMPNQKAVNVIQIDLNSIMKSSLIGRSWEIISKLSNMILRKTYPVVSGIYTSKIFEERFNELEKNKKYDLILIRGQGTFEQIWRFKDKRSVRICVNVSKKNYSTFIDKIMSRCYYNNVKVNCNSEGSREFYVEKFKRENIDVISLDTIKNPFFTQKVIDLSKEKNNKIPNTPYILGLGRLVKTKNFGLLIDSYYELKTKYNVKHKLILVGDGDDKVFLEEKCKSLKLNGDVIFAGYQSNPYPWIKNSEIIVFTSKKEGLSNVLIEAMCCKTRILITKSPGGMLEMMQGNLSNNIAENKKDDIALKINNILNKEKEFYYSDYEKLLSLFNPSVVVKKWIDMYAKKDLNV